MDNSRRLITKGIVDKVFPERHSVRVKFPDKDDMTSAELPVLTGFCGGNSSYMLPDIGEVVACIFETEDDESGTGYVVGAFYDDKVKPKVQDINKTRIDFKDGTFIEYDRNNSCLRIECKGDIILNGRNIHLNQGSSNLTAGELHILSGSSNVYINGKSAARVGDPVS